MAALTRDELRESRDGQVIRAEASGTVYVGSLCQFDAAGKVKPITGAANLKVAGVAATAGKSGDVVELYRKRAFKFAVKNGDTMDAGDTAYAENDNEVTTTNSSRTEVGVVIAEDSDGGAWVEVG